MSEPDAPLPLKQGATSSVTANAAPPSSKGEGKARPVSLPLWGRWPSAARSDEVVSSACRMDPLSLALREPAVSIADGCAVCPETLVSSFSLLLSRCAAPGLPRHPCAGANAAPAPAQGASPLDPFSLARFRGVGSTCRFHCGCRHPLGYLLLFSFLLDPLCRAWAAATSLRRG